MIFNQNQSPSIKYLGDEVLISHATQEVLHYPHPQTPLYQPTNYQIQIYSPAGSGSLIYPNNAELSSIPVNQSAIDFIFTRNVSTGFVFSAHITPVGELNQTFYVGNYYDSEFDSNGGHFSNYDYIQPPPGSFIPSYGSVGWYAQGSFMTSQLTYGRPILRKFYSASELLKPQVKDYFTGYSLDANPYKIELDLTVNPVANGLVKLHYYHLTDEVQKDSDGIDHNTVDIQTLLLNCRNDKPLKIKLDCIPCSISLEGDSSLCQSIKSQLPQNCFSDHLPTVKAHWENLYEAKKAELLANPKVLTSIDLISTPYVWSATPRWGQIGINDLNTGMGIGEVVTDSFVYAKYFSPQPDETYGEYIMPDSAMLKKISAAVDADQWGVNPDDPLTGRVDNLGWRIRKLCDVSGIRVKTDGTIDEELEKTTNRRLHADGTEINDVQAYNPNCFGSEGMLVRHLPNKFSPSGTVSGGYRKIRDIPQYLAELHEQANAAMGYQEGTAIEINVDGQTYRYPNQLALMTDIFVTLKQSAVYSKGAFFSSVVAEQTTKEVMAGLGLRTVDKFLEFKVAGKVVKLYYKGISASQSIRRKLSAITTNIGTIIGNIT